MANVHGYFNSRRVTQFNFFVQPNESADNIRDAWLKRFGRYLLADDCCPHASGHIHVVKHPYYAQPTSIDGEYAIEDIPPGTYELVCWHEGMKAVPVMKHGAVVRYRFGKPIEIVESITVRAGAVLKVDFEMPTRLR